MKPYKTPLFILYGILITILFFLRFKYLDLFVFSNIMIVTLTILLIILSINLYILSKGGKINRFIKLILSSVLIAPSVYFFVITSINQYHSVFSKDNWVRYPELNEYQAKDFISKYKDTLKTREDVINYLGKPSEKHENFMIYYIDNRLLSVLELIIVTDNNGNILEKPRIQEHSF